ncbi:chromosome partitioning protein ParA [Vibrio sp. 10N.286.49.B3]|uniref:chromosome partitioning protein ParA n=1 Tax=Vibrio sp. 10N.286.49.B3 TaxID=1880855 RepID=UPI000C84A14E|nr:chromosome partitioning protein ParA [Vibrio sp. 10N.286.49.B3]PMH41895.1 chromosome partitioning protein ParA [Vibrio sp. 10N.286.49.B3]
MVSINGLPPARLTHTNKTNKKNEVRKSQSGTPTSSSSQVAQPTKVANAVAHSIKPMNESDLKKAQLHYDLPEGHSRKAMQEYFDVLNQAKKEELAQMFGVDIYI